MQTKRCSKCGQEFPATKEYFRAKKGGVLGLNSRCKSCQNEQNKKYEYGDPNTDPNIVKACSRCGNIYPAIVENFYPLKSGKYGLMAYCKACTSEKNRSRNFPPNTDREINQTCSKCGQTYSATTEFFHIDKAMSLGVSSQCKACRQDNSQQWREDNPDKVQQKNQEYYWSHRDELLEKNRDWHQKNPEKRKESHREWYEANEEHARATRRNYYASHKDEAREYDRQRYEQKGDQIREYSRQYKANNPDKVILQEQKRIAREAGLPDTLTTQEWRTAIDHWEGKCAYCNEAFDDDLHRLSLDHYVPVSHPECPGTVAKNCLPAGLSCNASKGPKEALEWMIWRFGDEKAKDAHARILAYFASLDNAEA